MKALEFEDGNMTSLHFRKIKLKNMKTLTFEDGNMTSLRFRKYNSRT